MAKGIEIGTGTANKKLKSGLIGIGTANKKLKKILVGTASGNKIVWSSDVLAFAIRSQDINPITAINCEDGSTAKTLTLPNGYVPYGIATDNEGNIYISYKGAKQSTYAYYNYVAKYSASLDLIWEYTGTELGTGIGLHIEVNKNKEVYVVQYVGVSIGRIGKLSALGGFVSLGGLFDPTVVRQGEPSCMALDSDGNLYIGRYQSYNGNYALAKFDKDTFRCIWEAFDSGYHTIAGVQSVIVSPEGYIYFASYNSEQTLISIRKCDSVGTVIGNRVQITSSGTAQMCCDNDVIYLSRYYTVAQKTIIEKRTFSDLSLIASSVPLSGAIMVIDIAKDGTLLGITQSNQNDIHKLNKDSLALIATFTKTGLDRIKLQGGKIGVFKTNW